MNRGYTREQIQTFKLDPHLCPPALGRTTSAKGLSPCTRSTLGLLNPLISCLIAERGLTIINGVDAELTNHRSGERAGHRRVDEDGFPLCRSVAYQRLVDREDANGPMPSCLLAAMMAPNLVPATLRPRLDVLGKVTRPDVFGTGDTVHRIHGADAQSLIDEAVAQSTSRFVMAMFACRVGSRRPVSSSSRARPSIMWANF